MYNKTNAISQSVFFRMFSFMVLLIAILGLNSCEQNVEEASISFPQEAMELSESDQVIIDGLFVSVYSDPDYFNLSYEDQIEVLTRYVNHRGYAVDLKDYSDILYPNDEPSLKENQELSVIIDDHIATYGINENTRNELANLRSQLINSNDLTQESINRIDANIAIWNYVASNDNFVGILNKGKETIANGRGLDPRFKCYIITIYAGYKIVKCLKEYDCGGLDSTVAKVAKGCKFPDQYVDPCAGNSDPCCGVRCIQGYHCRNGNCVFDPYFDNCDNCLPGETCVNGYCQPY